jgi:ABC-type uncharacterized transport system substrate-binding protein
MRRVAMLWNAGDPDMTLRYRVSESAAQALGITVEALGVRSLEDFEPALSAMRQNMPDAMFVVDDRLTVGTVGAFSNSRLKIDCPKCTNLMPSFALAD